MQTIRLDQVLEDTAEQVQYTTSQKIIIEANELLLVMADENRIGQVINNILTNAIKFSIEADRVILRLIRIDNMAVCMIKTLVQAYRLQSSMKYLKNFTGLRVEITAITQGLAWGFIFQNR